MSDFTHLEAAVLSAICDTHAQAGEALRALLLTAKVTSRENTGDGFYTQIETARAGPLPEMDTRLMNGPNAHMIGMGEGMIMGFVLWLKDSYPDCLEGFQYCDSSGNNVDLKGRDLASLRFTQLDPPLPQTTA